LASEESGWHFTASNVTMKQLKVFNIEDMPQGMEKGTPQTWDFLGALLGDGEVEKKVDGDAPVADNEPSVDLDSDDSYWDEVDEIDLEGFL
ncbi:hypothetical protein PAXRUDRAFT_162248, partial [Paxillus rubicundulus Ve08.2h10]